MQNTIAAVVDNMSSNCNAYFRLDNRTDGMYIIFFPPAPDCEALNISEVSNYLKANKVVFSEEKLLASLGKDEITEIMLDGASGTTFNECGVINISANKMAAVGRFYPPSADGKQLSKEDILEELSRTGVRHGVVEKAIDAWLQNKRYCTNITLAKGDAPVDSKDAYIEYKFALEKDARPTLKEDGSVDFYQLDILNNVAQGDILAVKIPERQGKPGVNVLGAAILPTDPRPITLQYGQNVAISEDETELTALCSGHVNVENGHVTVHNIYEVKGDVGAATGNIDFDGSVRISGDVNSGYSVKATGNIFIDGAVAGASLAADGQIVVGLGINAGGKGKIVAGGDVSAKFIQEGLIASDGKVQSSSILNSMVSAKGNIEVTSGRGVIIGGELQTNAHIIAQIVGSARARVETILEIKPDASVSEQYETIKMNLIGMRAKLKDLRNVWGLIQQKISAGATLPPEKAKLVDAMRDQITRLESEIKEQAQEFMRLKAEIDKCASGRIVIKNNVYEGTKITISDVSYHVRTAMNSCQFVKDGFEIKAI